MKKVTCSSLINLAIQLSLLFCCSVQLKGRDHQIQTELPLVVIVCSYNNAPWVDKNLDSIFMQQYSNYRVIYVDDASGDGTAKLVETYRKKHHLEDKITLIANKDRCRKTKNVYNTFHSCNDDEIIVIVDGDDWLSHDQVFAQINMEYLNNDIWLTWGQFKMSETLTDGWGQPVPDELIATNDFREFTWVFGAPRTFYAWLFKQIKLEDFIGLTVNGFEGRFYPSSDDFAMMYPMVEMARDHLKFIPECAYIVNQYNPLSTSHAKPADPIVSMQTACEVKMYKKRYEPLDAPITDVVKKLENSKADIILLSSTPEKTAAMIASCNAHIKNKGSLVVVGDWYKEGFESLQLPIKKEELLQTIGKLPNDHLILIHDNLSLVKDIDIQQGIIDLERTGALGCFYHVSPSMLKTHAISCEHIRDTLHAWKIYRDANHAIKEYGCNMSLYRKKDILALLAATEVTTFDDLKGSIAGRTNNLHALGLCYANACVQVDIPGFKSFDPTCMDCFVPAFDKAMYATERHKEIYEEILGIKKEATFINVLRENYAAFIKHPPYSVIPKIPKILHHIWLGGPMPEQYVLWRKKWQAMHPDWISMLWTDKEVAHLNLENQEYYDETTSFGEKANLLRYELLYQFGGLYVDTDCECFRAFDLLHHCCDFYAGCEYPQRSWSGNKIMIGNSIMASRPGHPLVAKFINNIEKTWHEELQVARSGTRYATNIIKKMLPKAEDVIMIFPANMFYPWATNKEPGGSEPITDQISFVQPETWSLHYWHYTWKPKPTRTHKDINEEDQVEAKIEPQVDASTAKNAKQQVRRLKQIKATKPEPAKPAKKRILKRRTQENMNYKK